MKRNNLKKKESMAEFLQKNNNLNNCKIFEINSLNEIELSIAYIS